MNKIALSVENLTKVYSNAKSKNSKINALNNITLKVKEGEILIVPKGVEHRPRTNNGEIVFNLLFEPKTTLHTGSVQSEMTVEKSDWI